VWLNGSDHAPPADVEKQYLQVEQETHWPNPILSSASAAGTVNTGPSGVKMTGPYDYVPPEYWYLDQRRGGAFGFNTETSPGPAIPSRASRRKFLPDADAWPPSEDWKYHNASGRFMTTDLLQEAMTAMYAPPASAADFERTAQTMAYDSERAMFESYSRNKYAATGVIQWMLNNAWPSNIWHLYDYYLDAGGGYYGTKKACEPLHVQYSYDDHSVVVVNSTYQRSPRLAVTAKLYDFNLKELFSKDASLTVDADTSQRAISIPDESFAASSKVFFVDLTLKSESGEVLSRNFYWVPSTLTTFDWSKTDYTHTPAIRHEDMTELMSLPKARVDAHVTTAEGGKILQLRLHNGSTALAFQLAAAARNAHGEDLAPVTWSDNYIELMPGETRVLTATLPSHAPENSVVVLSGWNISEQTVHLSAGKSIAAAVSETK